MKRIFISLLLLFLTQSVWADLIAENIINGCDTNTINTFDNTAFFKPQFTVISYNCAPGYYLPADSLGCVQCLAGHECVGGTYNYNETIDQGIKYNTPISENVVNGCDAEFIYPMNSVANFKPSFVPKQYSCNAGYYLGANDETCTQCPANSYCPGGTLYFNEDAPQGINPCPDNQTSLAGSSSVSQCKTYTINWISNGETYQTSTCTINDTIVLPAVEPTRVGYTFSGWKIERAGQ